MGGIRRMALGALIFHEREGFSDRHLVQYITESRHYPRTAKNRKPSGREIRKAVGRQLRYVAWDLRFDEQLAAHTPLTVLSRRQYRELLVVGELHRQQREMYQPHSYRVDDRIVSIAQPDVRPIVRGKAKANVEFGPKVGTSVGGRILLDGEDVLG